MSGGFILNITGNNPFMAIFYSFLDLIQRAVDSLADPWNAGIILQVLAIGGVINLVGKMGGAKAIAEDKQLSKHDDLEPLPGVKLSVWNAIIPIGALIVGALFAFYYSGYTAIMGGEDSAVIQIMQNSPASFNAIKEAFSNADASVALFQSALFAGIVAMVMGVAKKIFTVSEALDVWVDGMKTLVITGVILICAWSQWLWVYLKKYLQYQKL